MSGKSVNYSGRSQFYLDLSLHCVPQLFLVFDRLGTPSSEYVIDLYITRGRFGFDAGINTWSACREGSDSRKTITAII